MLKTGTLRIFSVSPPGPLAEKNATTGAGLNRGNSFVGRIVAVGFLFGRSENIYQRKEEKGKIVIEGKVYSNMKPI